MKTITKLGIEYSVPKVTCLHHSGLGVADLASRTAYSSVQGSENRAVRECDVDELVNVDSAELVDKLVNVHFHNSVAEHIVIQYKIDGMSRGVLQEFSRSRVGVSPTVQSTRYTMSNVIYTFAASILEDTEEEARTFFIDAVRELDMFVVIGEMADFEASQLFDKLNTQLKIVGKEEFFTAVLAKDNLEFYNHYSGEYKPYEAYKIMQSNKQKKNAGDSLKHIVNDNWKTSLVVTFNARSLAHFIKLRDSASAYFLMHETAKAILEATPEQYIKLIK